MIGDASMPDFVGNFTHNLDDKGRVSLPRRFKEILATTGGANLVLAPNVDPLGRCLVAYPLPQWQQFMEKVRALPQMEPAVIMFKRRHLGRAAEIVADRLGRIVIPGRLRTAAELLDKVVFVGVGEKFEIWNPDRWREVEEMGPEEEGEYVGTLADLAL